MYKKQTIGTDIFNSIFSIYNSIKNYKYLRTGLMKDVKTKNYERMLRKSGGLDK